MSYPCLIRFRFCVQHQKHQNTTKIQTELIPRPARACPDPPLYLRLRMGRPIGKTMPLPTSVMSYGKNKLRPEFWFSVPKNRTDELYRFINTWVPHLYGELDEQQIAGRGFELIQHDTEWVKGTIAKVGGMRRFCGLTRFLKYALFLFMFAGWPNKQRGRRHHGVDTWIVGGELRLQTAICSNYGLVYISINILPDRRTTIYRLLFICWLIVWDNDECIKRSRQRLILSFESSVY